MYCIVFCLKVRLIYTISQCSKNIKIGGYYGRWTSGKQICLSVVNKKAQLSLTKPRYAKACQKLLQFDVRTTLSLTILAYLHSFSCCCVRNLRNPEKFTENSYLYLGVNGKPICHFLVVINCNFNSICYRFRDIRLKDRKLLILPPSLVWGPRSGNPLKCRDEIWHQKTRIMGLPDAEEIMTLAFFVLTQYRRVTDKQTDAQTR